jgi:hypothetical protein
MRKALLLATLGSLVLAGVAYGATLVNQYVIKASVTPTASGTNKNPKPVAVNLEYDVTAVPAGQRPLVVEKFKTSYAGLHENTEFFKGCSTSLLTSKGATGCPSASRVGSGFAIVEIGPSSNTDSRYNSNCRMELLVFNGGHHDLLLYYFKGLQKAGQPAPCPVPGNHNAVTIDANLTENNTALTESFSVPNGLLHPLPNTDAAVTQSQTNIPQKTVFVHKKQGRKTITQKIGLLTSTSCPPNHQRQIAITFTDQSNTSRTRTALVTCTGGQNTTRHGARH